MKAFIVAYVLLFSVAAFAEAEVVETLAECGNYCTERYGSDVTFDLGTYDMCTCWPSERWIAENPPPVPSERDRLEHRADMALEVVWQIGGRKLGIEALNTCGDSKGTERTECLEAFADLQVAAAKVRGEW